MKPFRQGGVYFPEIKTLAIADLHLGYEEEMSRKGISLPFSQYPAIEKAIKEMVRECKPEKIIIVGDLKHDFSHAGRQEFREIERLFYFLNTEKIEVIIVKGNHDNFLQNISEKHKVRTVDYLIIGNFLFLHGDRTLKTLKIRKGFDTVVMGHEHPCISLIDELGVKQKFRCLLTGKFEGRKLIVLPALSIYAGGTEVNEVPEHELLSPILRECDLGEFTPIVMDEEAGVKEFPKIREL